MAYLVMLRFSHSAKESGRSSPSWDSPSVTTIITLVAPSLAPLSGLKASVLDMGEKKETVKRLSGFFIVEGTIDQK